jgi:hypothetical protein
MYCSLLRRPLLVAAIVLAGCVTSLPAAVQSRISGTLANSGRQAIPGSVHAKVRRGTDLGQTPPTTRLQGMTLRFSMTQAQEHQLDQLLSDQQNPSSTRYHQWLTPDQYAAQFGVSSSDIAKVTSWLTSQGLTVDEVARSGTFVRFSGTVAQAQTAFSTSIHSLSLNGTTHFANMTDASVPAPLASVVSGITGLHNFRLKPHVRSRTVTPSARPDFTSSISGNHYLAPGDFYSIYNETPVLTSAINGSGVTIAVLGQVDILNTDIAAFRTASGLAVNTPTIKVYVADPGNGHTCSSSTSTNCPSPNLDDLDESSLDVEWAGATAPGANLIFVTSPDVIGDSLTDAIDNNLAPIMSISYGDCESSWGASELNTLNQLFKQANAQGITIVGPAGDEGATDCDYSDLSATQGLAVDFPASSPYVTAMGGTMFNEGTATGGTSYWGSSDTTISAGVSVTAATTSALSYIPEAVWNEDVAGTTFSAGGGGPSGFFTKPVWQVGTPADASRDVPDLALNSAASHDGYLYCVSGSCVNGTYRASDGQTLTVGGGTSFATPSFAGILALIEQKTGGARLGNVNPTIYALANSTAYNNATASSVFHDITTGNNNSICTAATPSCPSGGTIGFSATTGYDLATGWGSVNVYNLVTNWNLVTPLGLSGTGSAVSTTSLTATPTSVSAGATVTFNAVVSGTAGTPTGTVQFLVNNTVVGSPVTLSSGSASYTYTTSCSNIGQVVIAASYSGDATYAGSKYSGITNSGSSTVSPVQVMVNSGSCPDFTLASASPSLTVTSGTPSTTMNVTSINGFAGTVTFVASATQTSSTLPMLVFNPTSVTLTSGGTASTTITLSNITAELHKPVLPQNQPKSGMPWYASGSGVTLASLVLIVLPRRRRLGALLVVALSAVLAVGVTGCSAGNTTIASTTTTNTQKGTYTVTVTASAIASGQTTSHSTTVVFTVQ